ncbi:MAG: methyltransferase domain-containing protein [Thermoleophilia bacterium]|nr:methyltransferase domain-containing protein [Thermoleophilia bacterium]
MTDDLALRMRSLYSGETEEVWARIGRESPATYWEENAVLGRRDVYPALLARLQPIEGRRILDAGCGLGLLARRLAREGARVTAVDLVTHHVLEARGLKNGSGPTWAVADFRDLLGSAGAFDDVVLYEVLEDYGPAETIDVLQRLGGSGAAKIHMVFKQTGPWRGVIEPLLPGALLPTVDHVSLLRSAHLHTPYRLSHQESVRRRSYNVRLVELTLQPDL